jgi:hypothetical protein
MAFRTAETGQAWRELLPKRRVVILAEAGSGKTEEMKDRARQQTAGGEFSFYATVQDTGHRGVADALRPGDRARLDAWRSGDRPAWFFLDSVDEAKLDGVQLDQALGQLAAAIDGATDRAHVVLSGRLTDWEFRRDLQRLEEELPLTIKQNPTGTLTPDDLVLRTIRHEHPKEPDASEAKPLVVVMLPLDANRVRLFAAAKGARNLDGFIAQIEAANLWRFARRPLDLDWMVQYWTSHGELGSLSSMLESSLTERLRESDPRRGRRDTLASDHAFAALERIGAALVIGGLRTVAIPDTEMTFINEPAAIDLQQVLPEWSSDNVLRLLRRPVFDPATFGRARLHGDNQGVVSGYLTARWIKRLRGADLPQRMVIELLFADTYGVPLVKRSMRETAAWLSIFDEAVAKEVFRRDPFLLLDAGDPASLPTDLRNNILVHSTDLIARGMKTPLLDLDSIMRFARPDIAGTVRTLWAKHQANPEIRRFLLRFIWMGRLSACADIAAQAVYEQYEDDYTALFGGRALMAAGDDAAKQGYAAHVIKSFGSIRNAAIWEAIEDLFPKYLGVDDLLFLLANIDVSDRDSGLGLEGNGAGLAKRLPSSSGVQRLLVGLLNHLGSDPLPIAHQADAREQAYFPIIGAAAHRLLTLVDPDDAPLPAIDAALRLAEYRHERHATEAADAAVAELRRSSARRRVAFWRAEERLRTHAMLRGSHVEFSWQMQLLGWSPGLKAEDLDWLLRDAAALRPDQQRRQFGP